MSADFDVRVGAYAVIVRDGQLPAEKRMRGEPRMLHALRIIYRATLTGGSLRHEQSGSTDEAAWIPLAEVPALDRTELVDAGLRLLDTGPH